MNGSNLAAVFRCFSVLLLWLHGFLFLFFVSFHLQVSPLVQYSISISVKAEDAAQNVAQGTDDDEDNEEGDQGDGPVLHAETAVQVQVAAAFEVEEPVGVGTALAHHRQRTSVGAVFDPEDVHVLDVLPNFPLRGNPGSAQQHHSSQQKGCRCDPGH